MARGSRTLAGQATGQQGASGQTATLGGETEDVRIVVEPDGTILKIGPDGFGDWYNPVTGTFTSLADSPIGLGYHSTAVVGGVSASNNNSAAVPVPAPFALFGVVVALLGLRRRR